MATGEVVGILKSKLYALAVRTVLAMPNQVFTAHDVQRSMREAGLRNIPTIHEFGGIMRRMIVEGIVLRAGHVRIGNSTLQAYIRFDFVKL